MLKSLAAQLPRFTAALMILALYAAAKLPNISDEERNELASRFEFTRHPLPDLPEYNRRQVRDVSPSLEHISAWISSVGAAAALNDLDGDGLSNDVCWVDVRIDRVIVAPVPGTGNRYEPFTLEPTPLRYDEPTMSPMGCVPGDMNEDGRVDILVYFWGRTPIAFLRTDDGYQPCEIYPTDDRWFTNAASMADVDGDGHCDIIIGNYFKDGARILDKTSQEDEWMQHSMSRAANAGRNRILLWQSASSGTTPSVTFVEAENIFDEKVAYGWTLALGACDLDGDLLPEIYYANDFGPDRLLHNRSQPGRVEFAVVEGEKSLTTPRSFRLGHDSFKGMGVDFGDADGDGLFDIYISNIAAEYALEESHFLWVNTGEVERMRDGVAPFVNRSEPLGLSRSDWGWDSRLADFDNDGNLEAVQATGFVKGKVDRWPELQELAMGNDELLKRPASWPRFQLGDDLCGHCANPFFVRSSSGRFIDICADVGLGQLEVTRGIATGDVDGDGDLDFAVANQWEQSFFVRNERKSRDAHLQLRLMLPVVGAPGNGMVITPGLVALETPTRAAVGAQVRVAMPDGRKMVGQVDGGNGHSGCRSHEVHFGLGDIDAHQPLAVEIVWRDNTGRAHQKVLELTPGNYTIVLGDDNGGQV